MGFSEILSLCVTLELKETRVNDLAAEFSPRDVRHLDFRSIFTFGDRGVGSCVGMLALESGSSGLFERRVAEHNYTFTGLKRTSATDDLTNDIHFSRTR